MKKRFIASLICIAAHLHNDSFAQSGSQNITLLSNWSDTTVLAEPFYGIKYQGCWGYAANGREYAIIGSSEASHMIDITNPASPVRVSYIAGRRDQCIWREYKSYQNYLYAVSDDGSPNSFQIIDLSYLPDSTHIVHDDNTIFERSHTIYIDGDKLYCGSVKGGAVGFSAMAVFSLANPQSPLLLRKLEDDFPSLLSEQTVHDMFVRNDTIYASCGNDGLYIFKYNTGGNNFTLLGSLTGYLPVGVSKYNHSSFLTADGSTLVFADEIPTGLPVKTLDVTDLTDLQVLDTFETYTGATPHNPYIFGNKAIVAYYQDGVQIFDLANPSDVICTGYYDTNTDNCASCPFPAYSGCWGAYPDLPSGVLLASDMQNGLFVLDAKPATGGFEKIPLVQTVSVYPNPLKNNFTVSFHSQILQAVAFQISDLLGKTVFAQKENFTQGNHRQRISLGEKMPAGIYLLQVISGEGMFTEKITIIE